MMIYEIRNYYLDPKALPDYENWLTAWALPYMREHLDLVGFWVTRGPDAEVAGAPLDELGAATVTWIIRWPDIETRNSEMARVFAPSSEAWGAITEKHPGREHYRRIEARFAEELLDAPDTGKQR
ncbi:hypothetical protein [Pseudohaliea sp.]|uniref:hypothetical protein n=1 Tax=Pseudohaliea sp. TaxID=2740289 RepID=UPI0032ED4B98